MKPLLFLILLLVAGDASISAQKTVKSNTSSDDKKYQKALVNFDDFKTLVAEVETHRAQRLIDLDTFLKMSMEPNTVILDSRNDERFERLHLAGAIHLDFTNFTQSALERLIPDPTTRILIYCNNNFSDDQENFATKIARTNSVVGSQLIGNRKPITLALNIPTYINLYGYGYRNIFELDELVSVEDRRLKYAGSKVNAKHEKTSK